VVSGMPPCIGHDIFEGIAQYDLPLAFKHFEDEDWFTREDFNRRLDKFDYNIIGSKDKPAPVSNGVKLGGHAVQTWVLIRIIPILIGDKIKNKQDTCWRMILLLILMVQIVCSPNTNIRQVASRYLLRYINMFFVLFIISKKILIKMGN
jgi:hypothetical protein